MSKNETYIVRTESSYSSDVKDLVDQLNKVLLRLSERLIRIEERLDMIDKKEEK